MAQKRTAPSRSSGKPKTASKAKSGASGKSKAKAGTKKKSPQVKKKNESAAVTVDPAFRRQLSIVLMFAASILLICLALISGDSLWKTAHEAAYGFFGLPCVLWFAALLALTITLAREKPFGTLVKRAVWMFSLLILINSGFALFTIGNVSDVKFADLLSSCRQMGMEHAGGGIIGALTGGLSAKIIGRTGAIIVWCLLVFVFLMVTTKTTVSQLVGALSKPVNNAKERASVLHAKVREEREIRAMERESMRAQMYEDEAGEDFPDSASKQINPELIRSGRRRGMIDIKLDDDPPAKQESRRNVKAGGKIVSKAQPADSSEEELDREMDEKLNALLDAVTGTKKQHEKPIAVFEPDTSPKEPLEIKTPEEIEDRQLDALVKKVGAPSAQAKEKPKAKMSELEEAANEVAQAIENIQKEEEKAKFEFPPIDLLSLPQNIESDVTDELRDNAKRLINTLDEYGVKASVSDISRGPTVTRYEIVPAPGVKINKITTLSNDIALRLAAASVRIEAPIPGKAAVGIEIPNAERKTVSIRELIDSDGFRGAKGSLVAVVGKDIEGNLVMCDLAKMPHLLIAGSTGSGKSVCVNSMLISLMYKYTPDDLRLVLVDPKKVEFEVYNGIPHLLVPVVCNAKKAAGVLQWAVSEMQKRYEMLQSKNVRSLAAYNKLAEETGEFEKLCKIVIVIDEMADLMQASPKEVEDAIARLAAMARAAGMHMVLATQRPSVDVITGTIKNNIPSRIALTVSSQIDSRTILGSGGAEALIGYGDMLYNPMGLSKPKRVQGCFISDGEVESVIKFFKQNGAAEYDASISEEIERKAAENEKSKSGEKSDEGGGFANEDPTMAKAIEAVIQAGQASVSLLQRKLGVGYARAGKLIDQLEERGIVGPYEGSKPRTVLMTKSQWLEMTMSTGENSAAGTGIPSDAGFIDEAEAMPPFDIDDTEE